MPSPYDIDPSDIQILDPLSSGYPAEQLPDPFRDYQTREQTGGLPYGKPIPLLGAAVETPKVVLPKSFLDGNEPQGMLAPGHFNLYDYRTYFGKPYKIEEGGVTVLLPRGINGRKVQPEEAINYYKSTGQHLGIFKDQESADTYRKGLTDWQDAHTPQKYGLDVLSQTKYGEPTTLATRTGRKDEAGVVDKAEQSVTRGGAAGALQAAFGRAPDTIESQESLKRKDRQVGMVEPPNIDLDKLTPVSPSEDVQPDTLGPITLTHADKKDPLYGKTVVIPTIIDGKQFSRSAAIADYKKTGKHLGVFSDNLAAVEYINNVQRRQDQFYGLSPDMTQYADESTGVPERPSGRPELAPSNLAPGPGQFDTYPPQADVPDVTSNRGLLASTARGIPIPPPSEEESNRLIEAEQINKTAPEDRINVPELDIDPNDIQILPKAAAPKFTEGPKPKGMVEEGNLDINNRKILHNPDGTISTESSMSSEDNGKEVLIPTVIDGVRYSDEDAWKHYKKTGENLGKFDSPESADAYAKTLHQRGYTEEQKKAEDARLIVRSKLYPGEDKYFKAHPDVAGMAAEDNKVILNPYSPSGVNKDAVIKNEGFRIKLRQEGIIPDFEVTPEQKAAFKGTPYGKDEKALKETIAARIYSGDSSAGNVTPEQKAWVEKQVHPFDTTPEPGTRQAAATANRQRLMDAISATEKQGYPVPHGIGTPNEPEGDRGPTRDMENLVAAMHKQEIDALRAGDKKKADGIAQARNYWEEKIKTEGMTEEQNVKAEQQAAKAPDIDPNDIKILPKVDIDPTDIQRHNAPQPVRTVTAYRPGGGPAQGVNSAIEGGIMDAHDTPILGRTTMEDYQAGHGDYVTVAMDKNSVWQNQFLSSPNYPGVVFRVRDNGGFGNGKTGENWIDIAFTDPEKAKHMLLRDVPFNTITPEAAQSMSASRPNLLRTPDLTNAPDLKDITPAVPETRREVGFGESFSRENAREILGMGESLNKFVISPLLQGTSEVAKRVAPDSEVAKLTDKANKDWQTTMVDAAEGMRKSLEIDPATEYQTLKGEAGGTLGRLYPDLLAAYVTPGSIAIKFILPAATEGMDVMKRARERGANPAQQLASFAWGFAQSEAFVNLPLHVTSSGVNPIMRFLERTFKATLITGGAHEALRDINNLISPIIGTEQQPFDWKSLAKVAIPMGVFGGVTGGDARARPQGPIAEQAFPKGGEQPPPIPGGEVKFAPPPKGAVPSGAPTRAQQEADLRARGYNEAEIKAALGPEALAPAPTGEERFAPGAPKGKPYSPIPAEPEGAGVGLVASPTAAKGVAETVKTAKEVVKEATTLPKITDWLRAVQSRMTRKQLGSVAVRQIQEEFTKVWKKLGLKPKEIDLHAEAIPGYIQANGDRNVLLQQAAASKPGRIRQGYEIAANLTPEEVGIVNRVQQIYADYLQKLRAAGIDVAEHENYVNQMWQAKLNELAGTGTPRTLSDYFRFRKPKFFSNYFAGEQEGYIPKNKDIRVLLAHYMDAADTAISNKMLVKDMNAGRSKDGDPLLSPIGSGQQVEGEKGPATLVFPKGAQKKTADGRYYVNMNFPALRDWKWVANDSAGNPVLMQSDLAVHPDIAPHLENLFGQSWFYKKWGEPTDSRIGQLFRGITRLAFNDAQQWFKGTLFGGIPSGFHQVHQAGEMGLGFRINPFYGLEPIDPHNNSGQMEAMQHGLMLAPDRVSQQAFSEGLSGGQKNLVTLGLRKLAEIKGLGEAARVANFIDSYGHYLFERYIPGLSWKAYQAALPRNMQRFAKELKAGTVTEEQVKWLTADQVNASAGHMNKDIQKWGSDPTFQHVMSMTLIAPRFFEGRTRKFGQAVFGGKRGREQLVGLGITAAALYIAARVMNSFTDQDPHFELKRAFQVKIGNRWYTVRSIPGDLMRATGLDSGPGFFPFLYNRVTPYLHLATSLFTGHNYRGEKVSPGRAIYDTLIGGAPMPIQGLTNRLTQTGSTSALSFWDHFVAAMGFPVQAYSPISEVRTEAEKWKQKNKPLSVSSAVFSASKYTNLEYALEDGDPGRIQEELTALQSQGMETKDIVKGFKERVTHTYTDNIKDDRAFQAEQMKTVAGIRRLELARARKIELMQRLQSVTGVRLPEQINDRYFRERGQ